MGKCCLLVLVKRGSWWYMEGFDFEIGVLGKGNKGNRRKHQTILSLLAGTVKRERTVLKKKDHQENQVLMHRDLTSPRRYRVFLG